MFGKILNLFKNSETPPFSASVKNAVQSTFADLDWGSADTRTGASLYLILSKQFDLIGKPEGLFPYVPPFASEKARGALLGTSIAIAQQQYGQPSQQSIIDAAVATFSLAYGEENGRFYAMQTMRDSADGNEAINFASDWAVKDTTSANDAQSSATPAALYLAVAGMI